MKVFISWSGSLSKELGEAIRDWMPGVLQAVTPYFTPSDIEKGTRWSTDISKELEESKIGVLCVTRDNLHSDWILFEAGALSKSLQKSHVCPILFGITNTDLAGPLKQFQTTEFDKKDFLKLLSVINGSLGDHKLPSKTLEVVFNKWWPDLEEKVNEILSRIEGPSEPVRSDRELLEEIVLITRASSKKSARSGISPGALVDLLKNYITLHDEQKGRDGGYQSTLDSMKRLEKPISYIVNMNRSVSEELDELIENFKSLSYEADPEDDNGN